MAECKLHDFFFAPILFHLAGPIAAGQMGMTVGVANILLAFSSNWLVTKAPSLGGLIAQRKYTESRNLFKKSFFLSLLAASFGTATFLLLAYLLNMSQHPFRYRFLPPVSIGLLLIATVFNLLSMNLSIYLRAQKKDPMAYLYLVSGIFTLGLALILGVRFGALGVTAAYFIVVIFFQAPISILLFLRYRTDPHPVL